MYKDKKNEQYEFKSQFCQGNCIYLKKEKTE